MDTLVTVYFSPESNKYQIVEKEEKLFYSDDRVTTLIYKVLLALFRFQKQFFEYGMSCKY